MSYEEIALEAEDKMEKALAVLESEVRCVRTGRASAGLVDQVKVDYYGAPTPLKSLASITVPEPRMILLKPFDPAAADAILKALQKSEVGLSPQSDGKIIRLAVPPLSEDRRRQLSKLVREFGEKAKVSLRNIRREANQQAEAQEKEGTLTEDELGRARAEADRLTKDFEGKIQDLVDRKTREVMEV